MATSPASFLRGRSRSEIDSPERIARPTQHFKAARVRSREIVRAARRSAQSRLTRAIPSLPGEINRSGDGQRLAALGWLRGAFALQRAALVRVDEAYLPSARNWREPCDTGHVRRHALKCRRNGSSSFALRT